MANYISYSLYGSDPKYLRGAIKNADAARLFYPGWTSVFYCGDDVPRSIRQRLIEQGAKVIDSRDLPAMRGELWRFETTYLTDAELVIFRDTDSRLSAREAGLVKEWADSGKDIHIIRDHPNHKEAIMAGMWGARAASLRDKPGVFDPGNLKIAYGLDQEILRRTIYRNKALTRMIHDSIFLREVDSISPPLPETQEGFIGESYSENDTPDVGARGQLDLFRASAIFRFKTRAMNFIKALRDFMKDLVKAP
jgi:hypothetical protein